MVILVLITAYLAFIRNLLFVYKKTLTARKFVRPLCTHCTVSVTHNVCTVIELNRTIVMAIVRCSKARSKN